MKTKILLYTILLLLSLAANAQTEKGHWLIGASTGSFDASSSSGTDLKGFSFYVAPKAGYFLAHNFVAGLRLGFGLFTYKSYGSRGYSNQLQLAPFGRYYFPISERLKLPLEASFGYAMGWNGYAGSKSSYNQGDVAVRAGAAIFIAPSVSLDLLAGYERAVINDPFGLRGGRVVGDFGFSIYLGGTQAN